MAEKKLRVKQVRSIIGRPARQKRTMEALGLKRINHTFTFAVHIGHISHIEVAQVGFAQHFQVIGIVKETAHIAVE